LLLLQTAEGPANTLWGLLEPPPAVPGLLSTGWALLEGPSGAGGRPQRPLVRKRRHFWEVGAAYRARGGAIMRAGVDLSSDRVGTLERGDMMEVLEFAVLHGATSGEDGSASEAAEAVRPKLRAKVLLWKTRSAGWVTPRNNDGLHLLLPLRGQKLEGFGREFVKLPGRQRLGGA